MRWAMFTWRPLYISWIHNTIQNIKLELLSVLKRFHLSKGVTITCDVTISLRKKSQHSHFDILDCLMCGHHITHAANRFNEVGAKLFAQVMNVDF
jgi:hypothetical protein